MKMKFSAFSPHSLAQSGICDPRREGASSMPEHSRLRPLISRTGGNWMITREQSGGSCCRFVHRILTTWGKHTTPKVGQLFGSTYTRMVFNGLLSAESPRI